MREPSSASRHEQTGWAAADAVKALQPIAQPSWLVWLPVPLFLVMIAVLWAADLRTEYPPPLLLLGALNFFTRTLASVLIVYLTGRSFLIRGTPSLLFLGCGVAIWGGAGFVTTVAVKLDANVSVTISNLGAWFSALCHLAGAVLFTRRHRTIRNGGLWLAVGLVLALGVVGFITVATFDGRTPLFFVQGQGGTAIRDFVLASALAMFVAAAVLLRTAKRPPSSAFADWYAPALLLIAVGLFGMLIESMRDSVLDWTCRAAQYVSGLYMLVASVAAKRESGAWGITLEAALRASEDRARDEAVRFRTVLDAAPAMIWTALDAGCRRISGNRVAYEFSRVPEGLNLSKTGPEPENLSHYRVFRDGIELSPGEMPIQEVARSGRPRMGDAIDFVFDDGSARSLLGNVIPMLDATGAPAGAVAAFVDITERKRAEERTRALQQITAALSAALVPDQVGDVVLNEGPRVMGAKVAVIAVLAKDAPELDVRMSAGLSCDAPSGGRRTRLDARTALAHTTREARTVLVASPAAYEEAYPDDVADRRALELGAVAASPLRVGERILGGILFGFSGPREFSPAEVAFLEAIAGLTAQALERTLLYEESERRAAELRDADRRKSEFMAVLSHELRNPLAPIRNSLSILERAAPGGEQARQAIAIIDRQTDHLTHLVNDLLDLTRIARNKIQLQRQHLELNEFVWRTIQDHRSLFEERELQITVHAAREPVSVEADWSRMAQILGNLLQNAVKFTPRGGCVTVSVSSEPADTKAVIRVRDSGVGIEPEILGSLFAPFVQADSSLDRSQGGLGLGLALVKGLVELHGGEVTATSAGIDKGTEVIVRLPLTAPQAVVASTIPGGPRSLSRRVLIIEDNVDAASSLRILLGYEGHQVVVAHTGPEGLAIATQFRPEVLLCDIGLPGMDGYEVARAFRSDPALAGTYLVALTGYGLPDDVRLAAEAGFQRHLTKPPSFEQLERILAAIPDSAGDPGTADPPSGVNIAQPRSATL